MLHRRVEAVGWVVLGMECAWRVSWCCGSEHGRYDLSCMQKLWRALAVLGLYGMLECTLCFEIILLLNMADIYCLLYVMWKAVVGMSSTVCRVHLVVVDG